MKAYLFLTLIISSISAFGFECPKTRAEAVRLQDNFEYIAQNAYREINIIFGTITPQNEEEVRSEVESIKEEVLFPTEESLANLKRCTYGTAPSKPRTTTCSDPYEIEVELPRLKKQSLHLKDQLEEIRRSTPQSEDVLNNPEYRRILQEKSYIDARVNELQSREC